MWKYRERLDLLGVTACEVEKKKKEAKQNIEFETPERGLFVDTYFNTCKCYTKKEAKMHLMILKLTLLLQED